ncbi:MAG: aminotransferase class I/II-fold pyridoxal phosphate-dependent enzyme, partial [Bacteroidales bacterium]|nr:aminotransferase class I/II-fold pyridoxal phosphate-dependent enzyme [Bacteroidales bacterium]
MKHSFGSDNHSGVHPVIMEAIQKENNNFATAYGEDNYTKSILEKLENLLGGDCTALFVFNGTGANIVALQGFLKSYNSVLAPVTAHINVDECGAVEKVSASRIVPLDAPDGKVTPEIVKKGLTGFGFQHHAQPKILSISQPTELGTNYTPEEIKELAELMHSHGCYLHVDGSRISNAAESLGLPIKAFIADCGVDVLSFGGTKNGLLMGEAVVVFHRPENTRPGQDGLPMNYLNKEVAKTLQYYRKQTTQLYSKSRFIAAQFTPGGDYTIHGEAGGGYGTPTQEMVESYELAEVGGFPDWSTWHDMTEENPPYDKLEP